MGLTITTDDKGIKIYRSDKVSKAGNNYTTYCIKVASKDKDGNWQNAFIDVSFKKGVSVNNKADIKIKNAFYTVNSFNGNNTLRLIITDFDVIGNGDAPAESSDAFMNIPDGIEEEIPFD